jgi:predicted small metal-binding protein
MHMSGQLIECPCGTVLRGDGVDEVVAEAQRHAKAVHDMELTDEQATAMARPA